VKDPSGRRWAVALVCGAHALVYAGIAFAALRVSFVLAAPALALSLGFVLNAWLALARPYELSRVWPVLSWLLLCLLAVLAAFWFGAIAYLSAAYAGLGFDLVCALVACFGLALSITLPVATWGLGRGVQLPERWCRWGKYGFALCALGILLALGVGYSRGRPESVSALGATGEEPRVLDGLLGVQRELPRVKGKAPALLQAEAVVCPEPVGRERVTVVASFVTRNRRTPRAVSRCFQAVELAPALEALAGALRAEARRGPVKLDVVRQVQALDGAFSWLDALKLRPGLDGACRGGECLMPWQLLAQGFFSTYRPMPTIPDFQFGIDPAQLWRALAAPEARGSLAGLTRITTESYVLDGELVRLDRLRRRDVPVTEDNVRAASASAELHILRAQLPDGKFRYTLEPFTGVADTEAFSLPRQAGVTLVLCELGSASGQVEQAIQRSLGLMQSFMRESAPHALAYDAADPRVSLGPSALPLVAFLSCSERSGFAFDTAIARLAEFVLQLQREDGGFNPAYDAGAGSVITGQEPLYTGGQAVLALVLLEQRQRERPNAELPSLQRLHAAVERAMTYFATHYWSHPLRDFFFLEENWHCLAARAALDVHRHAAYERFCLDYVRFKSRLILEAGAGMSPEFDGGFGFGNVIPPHNTGASGTGEALAAALAIEAAGGARASSENAERLRRVIGFLLRQQWAHSNCFACVSREVEGGLSEHTHSATTRIDFIQHAWAAWGHGGRVLGLMPQTVEP
jgi:hypothetical protein